MVDMPLLMQIKRDQQNSNNLEGVQGTALCRLDLVGLLKSSAGFLKISLKMG
jgi:hypothetical protein